MVLDVMSIFPSVPPMHIDQFLAAFDFNAWTLDSLLKNAGNKLKTWVALAFVIFGAIAFGFGGYKLAKGVFSEQQKGKNFAWALIGLAIGALLMYNGFNSLNVIGKGLSQSIKDLGK